MREVANQTAPSQIAAMDLITPAQTQNTTRERLGASMLPVVAGPAVEWHASQGLVPYPEAVGRMEAVVADIHAGKASERVWLCEHPPLYTAGTSAQATDLLQADRFPVFQTGRGGEYTYHGPGQRVVYVMLELKRRKQDVRAYVAALEDWIIAALGEFNIKGERREDRVGVWVQRPDKPPLPDGSMREDKIAAIGIRIRRWVTFHGIAINVEPDLSHYTGIVPCGVEGHGVTSLIDLGLLVTMGDLDVALMRNFEPIFGDFQTVT